ncbi:ABC transporter permease [Mucilaginibacter robiniae]|uniref:ABC transporter permease n=1 Tax=Mucilaginibacter robiniae TaxID=2728022 RepID=A0A7L5E1Y2_9SPHI|nr:ABC transporter permease [Mucilaginibacter robiniae]QJD96417.1 ABC transporter permease [Mucilaginibacter robiniae]
MPASTDYTPAQRTWQLFRRNKAALAGLAIIIITVLAALLGYLIMPDNTPAANNMSLRLSLKKPGTTFRLLRLRRPEKIDTVNLLTQMLYGQPSPYQDIPITSCHFTNDSVIVQEYVSAEDKPERKAYNIFEVVTGHPPTYKSGQVTVCNSNKHCYTFSINPALYERFRTTIQSENLSTKTFWLGTDIYGRDLLSRLILGARISLSVGLMAVLISLLIGVSIGAIAGYYGGWIDAGLSWLMNILWSLPALLLVIALSFALGKGLWQIFIAVGLSMWVEAARVVRGQVISLKQAEYIEAARALGYTQTRIIIRHILPNIAGPVLVIAASNFASAILLEAGLSFLGFGAQPPVPTWGGMIREHYGYIIMDAAYLAVLPGLAIMLMVYAFNLVTVGLRDAFDIKSQNIRL